MADSPNPSTTAPSPSPSPVSAAGGAPQSPTVEPAPEGDWGTLLTDYVEPVEDSPQSSEPAPQSQAPVEPAPTPATPAPAEPVEPATPPEPVAAQPPAQPEGPTPEWRQGMVRQLAPKYEFTPETREAFEDNPAGVMSQLAATVHVNIIEDVARMIDAANAQLLPQILQSHFSKQEQVSLIRQKEVELVHTPYPKLREADPATVQALAKSIAKKHPASAPADRVRMLAEAVYGLEGWEMPWKGAAPAAPPKPSGYTPVAPGAGGGSPPRPADNPFADPELLNS